MAHSPTDAPVAVYPFTHRVEGDEAIIANIAQSSFLAIPLPALDLLIDLAEGRTIGQAQAAYAAKYGETPDVDDFLELLADEGFVALGGLSSAEALDHVRSDRSSSNDGRQRYHFERIPEAVARRLFGWPVLLSCGLVIGLAAYGVALDPSLIPAPTVMVFDHDLTLRALAVTAFILVTIFFHEMAHLVAARAAGVPARLGLSNRLWFLVAETDLTGVWLVSPRQRYLAFLAGPLVDATSGAVLILVLWSNRTWDLFPPSVDLLGRAFLFTYLVRLLWQCYFFLRTDFYYVFATFFRCKNLLDDTRNWLGNQLARVLPRCPTVDVSAIPDRELRVIRVYSVVWVVGRVLAFASLFLITLPILWGYCLELIPLFFGGRAGVLAQVDALAWTIFALSAPTAGLFLWLRQIYRSRSLARRRIG